MQLAIGAICGFAGAYVGIQVLPDVNSIWDVIACISLLLSFYLHTILHEGGHLVCGLLSGYRFVSFRIGGMMLIKAIGLVFAVIHRMAALILFPFAAVGIFLGIINLISLKVSGIANDGYNLISLRKDPMASKALWQQLRVNKLQSDGIRLKDIDEELFDLAESEVQGNPLIDAMKILMLQRLLDEKRFEEAQVLARKLLRAKGILDLYKNMIGAELLYLELMGECREDVGRGSDGERIV